MGPVLCPESEHFFFRVGVFRAKPDNNLIPNLLLSFENNNKKNTVMKTSSLTYAKCIGYPLDDIHLLRNLSLLNPLNLQFTLVIQRP